MRNAVTARIGYRGEHLQTIRFRRYDMRWLERNWGAASALLDAEGHMREVRGNHVLSSVAIADVRTFLSVYEVEGARTMERRLLLEYIDRVEEEDSSLERWNVIVVSSGEGPESAQGLGRLRSVRCVRRSPLEKSGEIASIKALMSKQDLLGDMDTLPDGVSGMNWESIKRLRESRRMPPLLLLYPIDRNSSPMDARSRKTREPMGAAMDVLGLGIAFPGSPDSGIEYVQADLQPDDAVETFEGDDALPEELIDGVR
jgi:hypothetical protein